MSTANPPQKPKRRWYRFSLKTLLIVVTITTVTFGGWVQIRRQQAQENRDRLVAIKSAVSAIEELGGALGYESGELRRKTWLERQFDDPGGPDDPIVVLYVTRVSFNVPSFGIDGALKRSTSLKNVTDEKLEPLKELTNLEYLDLSGTNITDAGLDLVQGLTKLEFLDVMDTQVTEKGVKKLQQALPHCDIRHQWRIDDPQNLREFSSPCSSRLPLAD